ncbi:MAG: hypothetical protein RIQ60_4138 [Pseudomonadota bacterium]|jgi:hypothetical protein
MPTLTLIWAPEQEQKITVDAAQAPELARGWLDEQYLAFDCAPMRASGKVLVVDKLLVIADAAGPKQFADGAWAERFAAAAAGATGRDLVTIDLLGRSVGY